MAVIAVKCHTTITLRRLLLNSAFVNVGAVGMITDVLVVGRLSHSTIKKGTRCRRDRDGDRTPRGCIATKRFVDVYVDTKLLTNLLLVVEGAAMDLFAVLAVCAALSGGDAHKDLPNVSKSECEAAKVQYQSTLQTIQLTGADRDAIGRVAFAEAANQGDSGLAGVVYTILNRLISGQFGNTVTAIVNAPNQFEPVHKAGGWKELPILSPIQQTRIETIINLALEGRLPDLTNGALFFQNPDVVPQEKSKEAYQKD
ncbi:cell wall hydrolase [Vibrio harveyi]|uniref:cell wall hydrolase n=1 Tax=Vibrio harveyi TaxID=669 RepID=UPI0025AF614D|nr:cell wall hydrolase [Vibrio harveyi]WJT10887.1 cell wall hydrolase [Vibrio harveyi]